MSLIRIDRNPPPRTLRLFGVSFLVLTLIIALVMKLKFGLIVPGALMLGAGVLVALVGLLAPRALRGFYVAWMVGLYPVNWVMSHVILFGLFYFLFLPIGLLIRLLGKDPLERRWDPAAKTYWQPHGPPPPSKRYFRQF